MPHRSPVRRWFRKHLGEILGITIGGLLPSVVGIIMGSWEAYFKTFIVILVPLSLYRMKIGIDEHQFARGFAWYVFSIILLIISFSIIFSSEGLINNNGDIVTDAPTLLYFSIVTWTTLGYGDLQPVESIRLWAAAEALVGYLYMGVLAGIIIHMLSIDKDHH
jgi:hypothetical protein